MDLLSYTNHCLVAKRFTQEYGIDYEKLLFLLLKCPTLLKDHCLVDFISHGHPSSLKASFESE
jgi:hypothetical protein